MSSTTVVGVMPREFEVFGLPADVYTPFRLGAAARRFSGRSIVGIGRLKAGVTRDQAGSPLTATMRPIALGSPPNRRCQNA